MLNNNQLFIINILGQKLYSKDGHSYYKIPVAYGTRLEEGAVADTCEAFKMKAVCYHGAAHCRYSSSRCKESPLTTGCANSMRALSKLICNVLVHPEECPQLEGMFTYMKEWSGSECGLLDGDFCKKGKEYVSSKKTPYYAHCIV